MTDDPSTIPMPQKISRYEIRSEIGRGGMATVYLAYDPNFGREVAIKVLPHELMHDPSFRTRFQREARVIAALEHPAIVPVYDFGEQDGQPFLVMRHLSGGSLVSRIRAGPIPPAEAAKILLRIGAALDAAHAKGVVHRDLKPANILFDQYGDAYLGDFGIAQLSGTSGTLTGPMVLGTPAYMSPEQIRGDKKVDGRSDIYALGIVTFEMLTGKAPFEADSPVNLMMMHLNTPPPRVPETAAQLPPGSSQVIERALAKEPGDRYQKAAEFGRAFEELTTGKRRALMADIGSPARNAAGTADLPPPPQPVPPFVPGYTAELQETPRRWPWVAAIGGLIAIAACVCLAAGGGGTLLAFSDLDQWLFGAPTAPPATQTFTAAPADTAPATPELTAAPTVEPATPGPTAAVYINGEPFLLSDGTGASSKPELFIGKGGIVHVFWLDGTESPHGKIMHRTFSPDGVWSDADCASCLAGDPKYVYQYQAAAEPDGRVCAVFMHLKKADYILTDVCYEGTGAGELHEEEVTGSETNFLAVIDPSGAIVPAFTTVKKFRIGGAEVDDGSLYMYSQSFAIDRKGGYHLLWIRDSDPAVLIHRYSRDQGATWSAASILLEDVNISDDILLLAGRDGDLVMVIKSWDTRVLRWDGFWSEPAPLVENFVAYSYTLAENPRGGVSIVSMGWYDSEEAVWLFTGDKAADAWGEPDALLDLKDLNSMGVGAAFGPEDKLYVMYGEAKGETITGDFYFIELDL